LRRHPTTLPPRIPCWAVILLLEGGTAVRKKLGTARREPRLLLLSKNHDEEKLISSRNHLEEMSSLRDTKSFALVEFGLASVPENLIDARLL